MMDGTQTVTDLPLTAVTFDFGTTKSPWDKKLLASSAAPPDLG
jgi:hypothetical protein